MGVPKDSQNLHFVWTIPLILVFLTLQTWLHLVWLHHEKEYCALKGISNIHSSVFDLPELWSGKATRQSLHSRALSCRLLVSNLGAAVGLCKTSAIKAHLGGVVYWGQPHRKALTPQHAFQSLVAHAKYTTPEQSGDYRRTVKLLWAIIKKR